MSAAGFSLTFSDAHPKTQTPARILRHRRMTSLTPTARDILKHGLRDRQLAFARLMFRHEVFHKLFGRIFETGSIPEIAEAVTVMLELNVCNGGATVRRRAQTVCAWLRWIMSLVDEEE